MDDREAALRSEFGPIGRALGRRYCPHVRVTAAADAELARLNAEGFVVHVQRTAAWVNYLYLAWLLVTRGLPRIRAVVNMRRWLGRPWRKVAQRGDLEVRFTYARRQGGSALVFLQQTALGRAGGKSGREDPFPALVALARKSEKPVFLVPELFVWEKWSARIKPAWADYVFGSPEAPGFLHSVLAFWRNHKRAQFRVGEPLELKAFLAANPDDPDPVLARKVRAVLHVHLARETRAVFGPPYKPPERVIEETLRDRTLRQTIEQMAGRGGKSQEQLEQQARRHLNSIAARLHPTVLGFLAPLMGWVFDRIYDGIEVDEVGLERALAAARNGAPIVLCPSHKSHIDYLVMSWVLWKRGYQAPVVAAGANLSFFPLGPVLRRAGAFFLRRSFGADRLYTATFKAYVKKLVRDGTHQEFFPEGGRSRTGKLLPPKLGLLAWEVDAVLEGARNDLAFIPVSIDYEKIVEGGSYSKELLGGEKQAEDVRALISAPRVLFRRYGRIHLTFDEPVLLREFMRSRGLPDDDQLTEEQKRSLVRALGNRIMWGIARVSTVTPHALVSAALLAQSGRGLPASAIAARVETLRAIAAEDGSPLSAGLAGAPADPTLPGPVREAMNSFVGDKLVRTDQAKGETMFLPVDERRVQLAYYKNTLMNLVAPRALVTCAVLRGGEDRSETAVGARALFLSRLLKFEFIYRVDAPFETIFSETVDRLVGAGLLAREAGALRPASAAAIPTLEFLADLLRDYLQSYLLAALTLEDVAKSGPMDRKVFVRAALETGRLEFLSGRLDAAEAISRTTLENALAYLLDQRVLEERERKVQLAPDFTSLEQREALRAGLRDFIGR